MARIGFRASVPSCRLQCSLGLHSLNCAGCLEGSWYKFYKLIKRLFLNLDRGYSAATWGVRRAL